MNTSSVALRRAFRNSTLPRRWTRLASGSTRPRSRGKAALGYTVVFAAAAAGAYYYPRIIGRDAETESGVKPPGSPDRVELEFEKPRRAAVSEEDHRNLISSQHLQVRNSWERPGVYAWGSNVGKVVDADTMDMYVKQPRRITYFDDQLLRDLKVTKDFGAAITENGDLVQWGLGYCETDPKPEKTLRGKKLVKLAASADRVVALTRDGAVYSIPSSRADQREGAKLDRSRSWWSLWGALGSESIHFRILTPSGLGRGEKVTEISSGLEHCLMLTNKGRVFSAASSGASFPSKGQMGIPGLSWETRPAGAYDQAHEVTALRGLDICAIATGDSHSAVLDRADRIFTFGDNTFGQLGVATDAGLPQSSTPMMVATNRLGGGSAPKVKVLAAGGANTFFTVDAATATDLWACGQGVSGTLGTGRWTHVSAAPSKVKTLSSLWEYDEVRQRRAPIGIKSLSIGATHCAAVLDNVTETQVGRGSGKNTTNWGADVLFWGGNEHYQLGTGRRSNVNAPTYIGAPEGAAADGEDPRRHRLCVTPRQTVRLGPGGVGGGLRLSRGLSVGASCRLFGRLWRKLWTMTGDEDEKQYDDGRL
ncbi:hypothetical protein L249_7589 [Ophiocordyceps polyrhachis-furcata BCC 54312]|uniref:Uncharacterized protein n=1 Tax=Ophiocordyceps polyrhachis-furcata BCC 54312 TaxID=1330021 RepID=A0A367L9V6_9HYPO|nr:hypothetical protein L249_7589 [Ophiocordyceps polyrhachis-furcata BCC 54312]